eukprot:TRINITY_DN2911_c0_g1_i1.p1 TRINITY_DN2911_c0_g1~~TRINITY_DN2911_c0_g1_i1.p1  ORF type:complete len:207 (+),score=77.39 TRINITY_DN2911_c0_g1_i1:281-901(+)
MSESPKVEKKVKKESALFKAKKNLTGKAATSALGKAIIEKILDKDTNQMMKSIKKLVELYSDKKKAKEIQNTIIKILLKSHYQIEKKNIDPVEFSAAGRPLKRAFKRLIKLGKNSKNYTPEELKERYKKVEDTLKKVGKIIGTHLGPHLTQKNKGRLTDCLNFLANAEFLQKAWTDDKAKEHRDKVISSMEKFLASQAKSEKASAQ